MATIDPRLLPLIEVLSASGADWLAFEILDGIRVGRRAEDSEEELREARRAVSAFRQKGEPITEREAGHDSVDLIAGDDQIDFAANYVSDRLADSIQMLESSFANLEMLAVGKPNEAPVPGAPDGDGTAVTVRIEGSDIIASHGDTRESLTKLSELRESLAEWAARARAGENTP